jgi:hypothetical protein
MILERLTERLEISRRKAAAKRFNRLMSQIDYRHRKSIYRLLDLMEQNPDLSIRDILDDA